MEKLLLLVKEVEKMRYWQKHYDRYKGNEARKKMLYRQNKVDSLVEDIKKDAAFQLTLENMYV